MSIPASNVRPHAFSTGTLPSGGGVVDLGFSDNAILVITSIVVTNFSSFTGDTAGVRLNNAWLALAVAGVIPSGESAPLPTLDRHIGDVTVEQDDAIAFVGAAFGDSSWAIHGYYWAQDDGHV